ncbi:hypothetical protein GIB67_008830 [Kingdonia uniflora]|uniref:Uncharacterized protein n=1 Tax=Kingdonia uniflora TaxID=39325 RepID=A0A7J7LVE7_9MAGN|nr:hypothetical protein GIB67_008830 [Kingdonia uniflora]
MDHCEWMNVKTIKICAPALKSCIIHDSPPDGMENIDCHVKVDAQSLISLNYMSLGSCEYSFPNLCLLVTASVNIKRREGRHVYHKLYNWTTKFLKEISKAKILTLANGTFEKLFENHPEKPEFSNMTHLIVESYSTFRVRYLLDLLLSSPNVESLVLPTTSH